MAQLRLCDGFMVDSFRAKFPGTLDIDEDDVDTLAMDDTAVIVAVVSVGAMNVKRTKDGELQRTNMLGITQWRVAKGEFMEEILDHFGFEYQLPLPLTTTSSTPAPAAPSAPNSQNVSSTPVSSTMPDPGNDDEEPEEDGDVPYPAAASSTTLSVQRTVSPDQAERVGKDALDKFLTESA